MHRLQIVTFGSVAIVFAVLGVNDNIFSHSAAPDAIAAGWLILAIVDILWVLYFTSEEDSLSLYVFNSLGTGGLTPPSRRRRTRTTSLHDATSYGGGGYSAAGVGPIGYDTKLNNSFAPGIGSNPLDSVPPPQSQKSANTIVGRTSPASMPSAHPADSSGPQGINSPLMSTPGNAGIGAGGGPPLPADSSMGSEGSAYPYRAKALYACACQRPLNSSFRADLKIRYRYRVTRRPQRDFLFQGRDFGYHRQERQVVAGPERRRHSWQYVPRPLPHLFLYLLICAFSSITVAPSNYLQII